MNPIRSLQHMLNNLARTVPSLPRLAETGTFDESTLEAVMIFQRDHGLPVTGIVNQETWDTIIAEYYLNIFQTGTPPPLHVIPTGVDLVREAEYAPTIFIVQGMMKALSALVSNLEDTEVTGINSGNTSQNLRTLQKLAQLEITGILDRATWSILAHLYRIYVTRRPKITSPL